MPFSLLQFNNTPKIIMNQQQQSFMTVIRSIDATTKINYEIVNQFFSNLRELAVANGTILANPLKVKGSIDKVATIYSTAICQYIFHLSKINREENNNMFDSHSNIEIRKTYIKQIAEFIKIFPTTTLETFKVA